MEQSVLSAKNVLQRTAETNIKSSCERVFTYISSGDTLPRWLKKCGPINGVVKVSLNQSAYNFVGASRIVSFDDSSTITEQLTEYTPYTYYSYSVTKITDVLRHLTNIGYGQWWFEESNAATHVKWTYSFVPKNFFARIALSLFLSLFYTRFMNQGLQLAKEQLEEA